MRILLAGASGFIGGHLLRALRGAGHDVIACVRGGHVSPGVVRVPCDFTNDLAPEQWHARLQGIDAVINAVGIIRERGGQRFAALHTDAPRALFAACEAAGVRRVIQISALGADEHAASAYHLSKRAADDFLAARHLDWLILRPSIVYGPGAHSSAFFKALAVLPRVPLVGRGDQPIQPIYIDDLVRAVLIALAPGAPTHRRIDCVGPRSVRFSEFLQGWRCWLGGGALRAVHVPYPLALSAGRMAGWLRDVPVNGAAIRMLQRGNHAEVAPFIEAFGFRPRTLERALQATPATQADRWHAGLYFLRPLLRLGLAFMWIWAGITSAFLYPAGQSFEMLAALGIGGVVAPLALYGAAALDGVLGAALLMRFKPDAVGAVQIVLMAVYSVLITWGLPSLWFQPFGPVAKNLPLIVATLVMMVLEGQKS